MLLTVLQAGRGVFIIKPDICFWVKGERHFFPAALTARGVPGPFHSRNKIAFMYTSTNSPTANQIARMQKQKANQEIRQPFPQNYAKSQTERTSPHA